MSINNIIELMKAHSNQIELPVNYKSDIEIDFEILNKYGNIKYIWMLRENGSLLFPLQVGASEFHLKYYLERDRTARFFHITSIHNQLFKELKHHEVLKLIAEEPIRFSEINTREHLIKSVALLLSDTNVVSAAFDTPKYGSEAMYWHDWKNWFSRTNPQMEKVMKKSIAMLNEFNLASA